MRLRRATAVLVVIGLCACSSSDSTPEGIDDLKRLTGVSDSTREQLIADATASGGVPESQQAAFEDGKITFEEYERGVLSYHDCGEEGGVSLSDPTLTEDRIYEWSSSVDPETDPTLVKCYGEHLGLIDTAWQVSVREAQRAAGIDPERDRLVRCLDGADVAFDEDATSAELAQLLIENRIDRFSC